MADILSDNLYALIGSKNTWTAPCTFTRSNAMPLDPKSCFATYNDLTDYLTDAQSTAYPGMFVAVTSKDDSKKGAYILMSNGTTLVPTKIGEGSGSGGGSTGGGTGTCGETCCVWVNNPEKVDESEDLIWIRLDNGTNTFTDEPPTTTADGLIRTDVEGTTIYASVVPAHTKDDSDNWVEGYWTPWTLVKVGSDGTEKITIAERGEFDSDGWVSITDSEGVEYQSIDIDEDNFFDDPNHRTSLLFVKADERDSENLQTYIGYREWIQV